MTASRWNDPAAEHQAEVLRRRREQEARDTKAAAEVAKHRPVVVREPIGCPPVPRERSKAQPRKMISLRITDAELQEIDERARDLKLSRTDYILRAALRQPLGDESYDERLNDLERRMLALEELAFLNR